DTLIVGGGPVGLSTAYHLATSHRENDGSSITIVERDPTYCRASATLSAGGIRQQFSPKQNVEMSLYGRDFLRNAGSLLKDEIDLQFQEHGYLFLSSTLEGKEQMIQNNKVQRSAGCTDIHLLEPEQLHQKFPWLNTSDILLGSSSSSGEGWFDPWLLIRGLKRKCQSMGVKFVQGYPISSVRDEEDGRVLSVDVNVTRKKEGKEIQTQTVKYNVNNVVNAAGAHCSKVMETLAGQNRQLQYPIPVEPRKRCIFFIHCATQQQSPDVIVPSIAPLTICPTSNVYFRSEGHLNTTTGEPTGNFLCGVSPKAEDDKAIHDMSELDYADHELFEDVIWPALYHRVPAFGQVKVKSSWAGMYEYNTVDQNAIIDFHPELSNVLMINGFSGHGLQQSPSAGRAGAELLSQHGFKSLDLSIFSFDRLIDGKPVFEEGI
ncbi:hypothetical protein THAPSDRAFT_264439, partial [Thalassiosira pseudonana CCMP1335]